MSGEKLVHQIVLHCVNKNSNKYYEISVFDDPKRSTDRRFRVVARWGRIEHFDTGNPQSQEKGYSDDFEGAKYLVDDLRYAKEKKGYESFVGPDSNCDWPGSKMQSKSTTRAHGTKTKKQDPSVQLPWWKLRSVDRVV